MSRLLRISLAFALAGMMVLTSLSVAVARGQAQPMGSVEICQGLTVVRVTLDSEGQPVSPVHLCPDVLGTLFAPPAVVFVPATPEQLWHALHAWHDVALATGHSLHEPQARGPPRAI